MGALAGQGGVPVSAVSTCRGRDTIGHIYTDHDQADHADLYAMFDHV